MGASHHRKVILGKRVITMHPDARSDFEGIIVEGDRIVRLIRRADLDEETRASSLVIDVGDRPLLPGFVDVHAHAEVVCRTDYDTIDCRAPECSKIADVLDVLSSAIGKPSETPWAIGQANLFFDRKLAELRLPTRAELDSVSRDRPIALRAGGHITVLNSKALEIAGIDRKFVAPTYSVTGTPEIVRDAAGEPTGVVKEMDTLLPFPAFDHARLRTALKDGLQHYFTRFGVTTVGEISETTLGIECMNDLAAADELSTAMRVYLWAPGTLSVEQACRWREHINLTVPDPHLRIQGVKLFADGGFSAKSAAVNCCYVGAGGFRGQIAFHKYFLKRAYRLTQEHNLQLAVHANGDRAQDWLCETITSVGGSTSGPTRMRIEHAGNLLPNAATKDWWARAGIIPVPQPVFLYTFGEYFPDYIGDYGRRGRFPFRTLLSEGWRLSGSSDVWVGSEREATNPMFSIWCCLKRQTYAGNYIDTDEAITLHQALRMHTLDAAATMGEDDVRGSLAPGKYADIIALEDDPFTIDDVDALRTLSVDFVMSLGRIVLDRTSGQPGRGQVVG